MSGSITMRGVRKSFHGTEVLKGVDLDIEAHSVVCIIGPSGSGKSTLLRCMNHLERMDAGLMLVDGDLAGYTVHDDHLREASAQQTSLVRRRMGMVFQQFNLFAHLTALQNVTLGPVRVLGLPRAKAEAEGRALLASVGLSTHAAKYPSQLSGGQQQRVAIARALAMKPAIMLFDEPTSALDPELIGEVLAVMKKLTTAGMTMVIVTHEISFARDVADVVVFMEDGAIVEQGASEQVLSAPTSPRTAAFLRHVSHAPRLADGEAS